MKKLVIFLHGALSSPKCWNYINFMSRRELKTTRQLYLEYDITSKPANEIVDDLFLVTQEEIELIQPDEIIIIGHSYGGIIGIELAHKLTQSEFEPFRPEQITVITMSTPLGGSGAASLMKFFKPSSYLFSNVGSYDRFMLNFKNKDLPCNVYSVITASQENGTWFLPGKNDSVVTVDSQSYFNDHSRLQHKHLECNHFEVLLLPEIAEIVSDLFLDKNKFVEHFSKKAIQLAKLDI